MLCVKLRQVSGDALGLRVWPLGEGETGGFVMETRRDADAPGLIASRLDSTRLRLLAVVGVMVIVWGLCLPGLWVMRGELEASIAETQLATVRQLADELDRKLRDRIDGLVGVAGRIDTQRIGDAAYLNDFLAARYILQQEFSGGTAIVGLDGYTIADQPAVPERKGVYIGDRDYFRAVVAKRQPYISKPAIGRALKRPALFIGVPVFDRGGEVRAVLLGIVDLTGPNVLGQLGATGRIGMAEVFLMSLKDDLFIVAPDSSRVLSALPKPGVSAINDRLQAGFEGSAVAVSSEGTEKLFSIQRLPTTGWLLELAVPTEVVFKPVQRMQAIILGASGIYSLLIQAQRQGVPTAP